MYIYVECDREIQDDNTQKVKKNIVQINNSI